MSLKNLQNRYSTYVQNECNWGKNIVNPSRCPAAPIYYKKLNDFIKDSYESSVKDTEKNQQKLLKERIEKKTYKDIYPIVNHDFDYKTAYKKRLNPYALNITNEPTINNLWKAPSKLLQFYDGLVKNRFPNNTTVAGIDDIILDDKKKVQIKNAYRTLDEELPYPSFRKDYPECRYPTTGKNASSYFIKVGKCKSTVKNKKDCLKKKFQWVPNKQTFPKIAVDLASTKKKTKSANKHILGACYKPQFAYIDNTSKGFYGQNGLAPSMFKDMLNISPDKLGDILAGNSIEGSGIIPCVEDFTNKNINTEKYSKLLEKTTICILIICIVYYVYHKIRYN